MSFYIKAILKNLSNDQEVEITKDKFTVGRSLQADYVLNSMAVSRIHFIIEKKDGIWTIKDMSTNGTLINDSLLKSTCRNLNGEDLIKIRGGSVTMKFILNTATTRFVTTSSAPVADFIVSTINNGDNLPSVSNDHCYERRGGEEARTAAEGSFVVSPVPPTSSSNTAVPLNTSNPPSLKRDRSPVTEESPKKIKTEDKPISSSDNFREELECSVCQELFIKAVTLNCSHTFCNSCILKWRSQRNYCPICREPIKNISPSIVLDNIIDKVVCTFDLEAKKLREEQVQERFKMIESIKPPPPCYITTSSVTQDLSTISIPDSSPELVGESDESEYDEWSDQEEEDFDMEEDEEEDFAGGLMDMIIDMQDDVFDMYDDINDFY